MKQVILFASCLFSLVSGSSQESSGKEITAIQKELENLRFRNAVLEKALDDIIWLTKLKDIALVDKVIITGPPSSIIANPTGQGAKNPLKFSAYVFLPAVIDLKKKYPLLVLPHDGVHGNFSVVYAHIIRELVAQGYAIVAPEYRGSSGYGKDFYEQIDYGGAEIEDVEASRAYMLENYDFIDKSRVGIIGWSHGGFNIFKHPENYKVAFAGVPVSDLVARMGYKNDAYRQLYSAEYHLKKSADQNVEEYRKRSPVWNAAQLKTPLLVYTNTNDEDVNVLEVEHLIQALKAEGKKFEYEIFKDLPGGHVFDRIDSKKAREIRVKIYNYLSQYLQPESTIKTLESLNRISYYPTK
ncbi:MAG: prolyl oligopeptidase family serine peptidase [Chitinophagaceae bacterium]